jgi:hypothetical protein
MRYRVLRLRRHRLLASASASAVACALVLTLVPRVAAACGAAYPGGPIMCEYPRARDAASAQGGTPASGAPIARASASWAYTSTTLLFGQGRRADLTRHAVFGAIEAPLASRLSLQVGAGGVAGGELVHGSAVDTIGPGWSGFAGIAGRLVDERGAWPFVQLTATLSVTHMITHTDATNPGTGTGTGTGTPSAATTGAPRPDTPRYTAFDLRAGAIVGKTVADVATPYVVGRIFGGPTYWRFDGDAVTGTDLHKYQVGAGLSIALFRRRLDVFVEGVPLGERGIAAGIGTTFF